MRPELGPPAPSEDEESIEQYMAKLLQRVRGDVGARAAASQAPPDAESRASETATPEHVADRRSAVARPSRRQRDKRQLKEVAVNWEAIARRAAAAPRPNLEALRALANESARRAISRHELKKHRRNAVTKVIVSTLAGMTSLWLMLESPNWLDMQFITACVSLLVAAYWAGEAFRALLESFRAAAYDGPEAERSMSRLPSGAADRRGASRGSELRKMRRRPNSRVSAQRHRVPARSRAPLARRRSRAGGSRCRRGRARGTGRGGRRPCRRAR